MGTCMSRASNSSTTSELSVAYSTTSQGSQVIVGVRKDTEADPRIEEVDELSSLVEGDQIAVKCGPSTASSSSSACSSNSPYYHHGIFIGNNKVIDFCQEPEESRIDARVREVDIMKFTGKEFTKLVKIIHSKEYFTGEDVVQRAKKYLSSQNWEPYNLFSNNCEHFATMCKTGRHESAQVNKVLESFKFKPVKVVASSTANSCGAISARARLL